MEFLNSTLDDLPVIFELYDAAIAHQKAVSHLHWLPFDPEMVKKELEQKRQWKIVIDGQVACVFAVAYSDPEIWGELDAAPSIYLHRIVTNPAFRGRNMVGAIVQWAKEHAKAQGRQYVRLDTWSDNLRLKELYLQCGFRFLGIITPSNIDQLPAHYSAITLSLFEQDVD